MCVRGTCTFLFVCVRQHKAVDSHTVKKAGQRDVLREDETRMRKVETFISIFVLSSLIVE